MVGLGSAMVANRQIGALFGVAVMGSMLHAVPVWSDSVPLAFILVAATCVIALVMVPRYLPSAR